MASKGGSEGWFCIPEEEGGVQNGRSILQVERRVCAEIREKVIYMAEHWSERFGVRSEVEETLSSQIAKLIETRCGTTGQAVLEKF